jgi:hypothetical protein
VLDSLKRLLRIRRLQEELGRADLEAEVKRLREIEDGSRVAAREAMASRGRAFEGIESQSAKGESGGGEAEEPHSGHGCAVAPGQAGRWREAESLWELAVERRSRFEARRPAQAQRLEVTRTSFQATRRERRQAERLVEAAAAEAALEEARREQRALDDWFQVWAARLREKSSRSEGNSGH